MRNVLQKIPKKPEPQYRFRDISESSLKKIRNLRNVGLDKTLVIIGNGPSLTEVDLSPLVGHPDIHTVSINKPHQQVWPTTYWSFFDRSQFTRHQDLWESYQGAIFNSTSITEQKPNSLQFKNIGGVGFSHDLTQGLYIGRSSVYATMQIALWMNYDRIYIFGCDMNPNGVDGKLYFYGTNPDVADSVRAARFAKEAKYYDFAARQLDQATKCRYVFCSTYNNWPFVDNFSKADHRTAVSDILHAQSLRSQQPAERQ